MLLLYRVILSSKMIWSDLEFKNDLQFTFSKHQKYYTKFISSNYSNTQLYSYLAFNHLN